MQYLKLLALLVICSSCVTHGRVIDDRYYDYDGWFSVQIPCEKTIFQEYYREDDHVVTMKTPSGEEYTIEVSNTSEYFLRCLKAKIDKEITQSLDMAILSRYNRKSFGNSLYTLRERGKVELSDSDNGYFAVVESMEGSLFRSLEHSEPQYSGCLIFVRNNKTVAMHYKCDELARECKTDNDMDYVKMKELMLEKLIDFTKNYQ